METSAQEMKASSRGISVLWAFVLMAISFVGGTFVGLHPSWIPIPGLVAEHMDISAPDDGEQPGMLSTGFARRAFSATLPAATQATTQGQ